MNKFCNHKIPFPKCSLTIVGCTQYEYELIKIDAFLEFKSLKCSLFSIYNTVEHKSIIQCTYTVWLATQSQLEKG